MKRKLRLELRHFYAVSKYLGALAVALNLPRLPARAFYWPAGELPRGVMMLWVLGLGLLGLRMDLAAGRAMLKDRQELREGKVGGGLNLSTFLALATPLLFLLDAAAIAHFYTAWFRGTPNPLTMRVMLHTALMAVGCVLWIYARAMPALPYGSIWGFRVPAAMESPEKWQTWHARAATGFSLAGAAALLVGTFL